MGGFEGHSGGRMSWFWCRYGARQGKRVPPGFQSGFLADRPWGRLRRGAGSGVGVQYLHAWDTGLQFPPVYGCNVHAWDAGLQFPPVYGCNVPACFPPSARLYFPCLDFSSNPSGHPGREGAGKKFPHPSGWPTPQGSGCPGLTFFLFLRVESPWQVSGNPGGRAGRLSHGPSLPVHSWTQGVKEAGSACGAVELVIWPSARVCVLPCGRGSYLLEPARLQCALLLPSSAHHSWNCNIAPT